MNIDLSDNIVKYKGSVGRIFKNDRFMLHFDSYGYRQIVRRDGNYYLNDRNKLSVSEVRDLIEQRVRIQGINFW